MRDDGRASRTAVLVCQGRAVADGRAAPGRFADPVAVTLLDEAERATVQRVREGAPPQGWTERVEFEMVRGSAEVIVPRTVAIDDAIRARPAPQLVIVGAGLDSRAWRLPELADVEVFEVDHPASQRDKQTRLGDRPALAEAVRFVPVDVTRDRLDAALVGAGHRADAATTWVWEGVVPYLAREEVDATVRAIADRSASGSRLIVNYQAPSPAAAAGRLVVRALMAAGRRASPWRREPVRSSWRPADLAALLAGHGFTVERDDDMLTVAEAMSVPVRQATSLATGRVAVGVR